ncbi:MAG: cupin domain-containing protein [Chloroflexota bacterium]
MAGVRVVHAHEMGSPAVTTPGMDRREAFDHDGVWAGTLRTEPGVLTGWHIHAGHDTYIYLIAGSATFESGPGGRDRVEASAGDFVLIPRGIIHREGMAAGSAGVEAVLVRVGEGEPVTNVDGPEPG